MAYSLNVTVVPIATLGYLTIWPTGEGQPIVSTAEFAGWADQGQRRHRSRRHAIGSVSVYVTDTTNVILDIDGYFAPPGGSTLAVLSADALPHRGHPQQPGSRDAAGGSGTRLFDSGKLRRSQQRDGLLVQRHRASRPLAGLDYLTVWPKGETQPVVSTLNDDTGTVVANAAIVPAGSENATAFYAHSNTTNLLIDVDGYFAAPGTGGCRCIR